MNQSELKKAIETKLITYIKRFVRYAGYSHLTRERKEIIAGAFAYLQTANDAIPDDVPNIGYLDDLMVFVESANHFLKSGAPIAGVCSAEEVKKDLEFVNHNISLMVGGGRFSLNAVILLGKKHADNLDKLAKAIKAKYAVLGDFNND